MIYGLCRLGFPEMTFLFVRASVWQSGMRLKYVTIDGLTLCYGEKGQRKKGTASMLLIHGFSADKFMWVPLVKVSTCIINFTVKPV